MIVFPNCKINLGLKIIRKRSDGYHDIATLFYPVPLCDSLEVVSDHSLEVPIIFTSSGLAINTSADNADNLCVQAFHRLKTDYPTLPAIRMHLHKSIPMGAGLGGGSSDAAFALKLLNDKFQLGLTTDQLEAYALELGSDCPFFIRNEPCLAEGRGEIMTPFTLDLSAYSFVVVYPGIHVSTPWAFGQVSPSGDSLDFNRILSQPPASWKDFLVNDFEAAVASRHPEIANIKETLYRQGALYASMSGSGSAVFGIFASKPVLSDVFDPSFRVFIL